jgi:hypothetical protein
MRGDDRILVYVGDAADKRWWWNFTDPRPVDVRARGVTRAGTGRLVPAGHPNRVAAECLPATFYEGDPATDHHGPVAVATMSGGTP